MAMKYFTLSELTKTNTGLLNVPNVIQVYNLSMLVENVLDPARYLLGEAIHINSAFRTPEVNRAVKGAPASAHMRGQAADIQCSDNRKLFKLLKNDFNFTQLINERNFAWIHISYDPEELKCEVLNFDGLIYTKYNERAT
jgi:zinc D-Ala-D-Ala carboxypeptidase